MNFTQKDLKLLRIFLKENEEHFSKFTLSSELLSTEIFNKMKTDLRFNYIEKWDKWITMIMIVKCSDIYHEYFKNSDHAYLRELIAKKSDKYHDYFKNDNYWTILEYIARKSDKYHDHFKDSQFSSVRYIVAKYSNKYDDYFKNDNYWRIQKLLESRRIENIEPKMDINKTGDIKMPYIKNELREELLPELEALKIKMLNMKDFNSGGRAGILNYAITNILDSCFGPLSDAKYRDYNEAIGMLECCKLEFYRKAAAPYEDLKEKENGKVLDGETRKPPKPASVKITPTEMMMAKPTEGYDRIIDPALAQEKELFLKEMLCNNPLSPSTFFSDGGKTRKIISEQLSSIFNPELSQSITDCGKSELEQNGIHVGSNMSTSVFGSHKIIGNCSNSLEASHATKLMISMKERIESGLGKYMEENPEIELTGEFTVVYTVKDDKIKESNIEPVEFNQELFNTIKDRIIFELNHLYKPCKSEEIKLEASLRDIGLDRSDIITICCEFEHTFKIPIGIDQMEKFKTVGDLYKYFNKSEK